MAAKALPAQDVLLQLLSYDPETGKLFWKERGPEWFGAASRRFSPQEKAQRWNARKAGTEAFTCLEPHGYFTARMFDQKMYAHRVIWKMVNGDDADFIDHIDGDTANNRIANLRRVTHGQNMRNTRLSANNKTGALGVRQAPSGNWIAEICVNYKNRYLGTFATMGEAIEARKSAERQFGFHENHGRAA